MSIPDVNSKPAAGSTRGMLTIVSVLEMTLVSSFWILVTGSRAIDTVAIIVSLMVTTGVIFLISGDVTQEDAVLGIYTTGILSQWSGSGPRKSVIR